MSTLHFHHHFDNPLKSGAHNKDMLAVMLDMAALVSFFTGVILWRISENVVLNDGLIAAGFALYIVAFIVKHRGEKHPELN